MRFHKVASRHGRARAKNRLPILGAITALAALIAGGSTAQAGIIGDTVAGQLLLGTSVAGDFGTAIVGPGVEFTDGAGIFLMDFANTTLTITLPALPAGGDTILAGDFAGFAFEDLTKPFSFAAIDAATNLATLTAGDVFLSDGTLFLNLEGQFVLNTTEVVLDLGSAIAAVPEPGSFALFAAGLVVLALLGLCRRNGPMAGKK